MASSRTEIFVFVGPTLSLEEAREVLPDAVYLPPAAQGEVYVASREGPWGIGIIDGYFERVPAVWHKEILWAMSRGIHVFGSASMGALRAAELAAFGMEGVGEIYSAFHRGELDDDDEVALTHGPAESGYRAGSEAMVNLRATLKAAVEAGVVRASTRDDLISIGKSLFYPLRDLAVICERGREAGLPLGELEALRAWLPSGRVDQKRLDALAMLRRMAEHRLAHPGSKEVAFQFQHTEVWEQVRRQARKPEATVVRESEEGLLDELRLRDDWHAVSRRVVGRALAIELARSEGEKAGAEAVERARAAFLEEHGLSESGRLEGWLREQELSLTGLERLLRQQAVVRRREALVAAELERYLSDDLRLSGDYGVLARRARQRKHLLSEHGLENPRLRDTDLSEEKLWRWYFEERLSRAVPSSLDAYARDLRLPDVGALRRLVLREWMFVRLLEEA